MEAFFGLLMVTVLKNIVSLIFSIWLGVQVYNIRKELNENKDNK